MKKNHGVQLSTSQIKMSYKYGLTAVLFRYWGSFNKK